MKIMIICTLGPASYDPVVIGALEDRGVDLFRINLSHTALADVPATIEFVRRQSAVPISLDTEGAQVRCGPVVPNLVLEEASEVELVADEVVGTADRLTLRPRAAFATLACGSRVSIDFNGVVLRVVGITEDGARSVVERGGRIGS